MWAQWNASGNANPTDANWLNGPTRRFAMPWPSGEPWYYTPMQVANLSELNYSYQELGALARPVVSPLAARLKRLGASDVADQVARGRTPVAPTKQPELLGASSGPVVIAKDGAWGVPVQTDGGVRRKVARSLAAVTDSSLPDHVYLKLENVRGTLDATVLDVFINLPANATAEQRRASLAGEVALFGLRRASVKDGDHGGAGLTLVLDITQRIDDMHLQSTFDVASMDVSLVPQHPLPATTKISVDRISAYRQGT
jgi:tyrosinase